MIDALLKSIRQLPDKRISAVILGSIVASIIVLGILGTVAVMLVGSLVATGWGWLDTTIEFLSGAGTVVLALFLFPAFVGVVASLFLEQVADAVEDEHYPSLPEAAGLGMGASVWIALKFAGVVLLVNLLALPFYVLFLFLPPANLVLFYVVNGYLLGREYYELVGLRRLAMADATKLRRANRGRVFVAGMLITLLTTIPIVNFVAPVLATAFMTHIFHGLRQDTAAA